MFNDSDKKLIAGGIGFMLFSGIVCEGINKEENAWVHKETEIPHESHNPNLHFSNMVVSGTTSSSASSISISGDTLIL